MATIRDRLWTKAAMQRIPLSLALELSPMCNLSCKMCYVRKSPSEVKQGGGLIPGSQWLAWAREAQQEGMLFPLITGGEPFLYPDFWQVYDGLHAMGMKTSINSNATLIDLETAKRLAKTPPIRINITLYGAGADSYRRLCGDGSAFERVQRAIGYLREFGVPFRFNCSITPHNVGDVEDIIAFAKELDVPLQMATYMFPPIRRDETKIGQNDRLTPDEEAEARVRSEYLQYDKEWLLGQTEHYSRFVPLEQLHLDGERKPLHMVCRAGTSTGWVDWQGNLSSCGVYRSMVVPLKDTPFAEAWKQVTEFTRDFTYRPACSVCPNWRLCHTCIATVHNESGSEDGRPEYMCQMNEAAARWYRIYAERHFPEEAAKIYAQSAQIQQLWAKELPAPQDSCGLDEL